MLLEHAVDRTMAIRDQLGVMWGPGNVMTLAVHGPTHDQIHQLGGRAFQADDDGLEVLIFGPHVGSDIELVENFWES